MVREETSFPRLGGDGVARVDGDGVDCQDKEKVMGEYCLWSPPESRNYQGSVASCETLPGGNLGTVDTGNPKEVQFLSREFPETKGLFETHPDVQTVFHPFRGIEVKELRQNKELKAHALRVMGFVQKVVARLDDDDQLDQLLAEIGRNHQRYGASRRHVEVRGFGCRWDARRLEVSFAPKPLIDRARGNIDGRYSREQTLVGPEFITSIEPVLGDEWRPEVAEAWTHLFRHISGSMQKAMLETKVHGSCRKR
ncbi:unnamed protein product [Darwinula stevensoni]|uniref:Globin domain-containing protein n=1 Tax=Darwinula stevensoni TaxID=69355 RepID=A0A7R9AFU8_9CRUS|nr:unnamed protein product [Darwinula stevensoni]CAG0903323.1 unnamed protein product [Darwinula stevensoni]